MYSVEEIKELLRAFDGSKANKLEIRNEKGELLRLSQNTASAVAVPVPAEAVAAAAAPVAAVIEKQIPAAPFVHEEEKQENEGDPVTSPMVGVFYAAPSPDKDPYVTVGSKVSKGDVLCLIEAMKLMNEVTAEKSGEITAVCVENGQVVEYGQNLFMIK